MLTKCWVHMDADCQKEPSAVLKLNIGRYPLFMEHCYFKFSRNFASKATSWYWLKAKQRIEFKVAVLVYKCLQGSAPHYLADELCRTARTSKAEAAFVRHHLHSSLSAKYDRQLLVIDPSWSPDLASGTLSRSMSPQLLLFKSSGVVSRLICSPPHFHNILYSAWEVAHVTIDTQIVFHI